MFTPGDNDWTDCDRPSNGGFNSLERLDYERRCSSAPRSRSAATRCGRRCRPTRHVSVRLGAAQRSPCVENRRWTVKGVTYVTMNVQGSCNNLCDTAPNPDEYARPERGRHRVAARNVRRSQGDGSAGGDDHRTGRSRLRPVDATRAPLRDPKTLAETDGQPDGFQVVPRRVARRDIAFGGRSVRPR